MAKYRKKPVVVDVVQTKCERVVFTAHGQSLAHPGDYIVTDPNTGNKCPVRQDIFEKTYERVNG